MTPAAFHEKVIYHEKNAYSRRGSRSGDLDRGDLITCLTKGGDQAIKMIAIASLALDVEAQALGREVGEDALV
jgi:hypothetical protein